MNKILSQALKKAVSEYSPEVKEVSKNNRPDLFSLNNETELFQNDKGGKVFSVGSITFCGSLPYNNFKNNISTLLKNILNNFLN